MMNSANRKSVPKNSLEKKVFRVSMIGSFLLGIVLMVIFLGIYSHSLATQYIVESFALCKSTRLAVRDQGYPDGLIKDIIDRYEGLSDAERATTGSAGYREKFADFSEQEMYLILSETIKLQNTDSPWNDIYIGVFDSKRNALVYVCDPPIGGSVTYKPGEWEPIERKEIDKFMTWDGNGRLYDFSDTNLYGWMCTSGVPLGQFGDDYIAFVFSDVLLTDVVKGVLQMAVRVFAGLLIGTLVIGLITARRIRRQFIEPVNRIAAAAGKYLEDRRSGITSGNHFSALGITTDDEIENLCEVMGQMETGLNEYEANITRITAEKERISTELSLAALIQEDALPNHFPAFPDRDEFDLYASMDPAKEIGGDFYDFFLVDDDHLCILIADVSGKGIPASLFMMASKIVFADNAKMGRSPAEIMEAANNIITRDNQEKMFVTAWVAILEISTGIVTASNAGHEYPMVMNEEGRFAMYKDKHGFILGGLENMKYSEYQFTLKPGDSLFVYTDGLAEASNCAGDMFTTDRVLDVLNENTDQSPQEILNAVSHAVDEFTLDAEQFDDLTMLCLKYNGVKKQDVHEIILPGVTGSIDEATGFVNALLEENGCSLKAMTQIDIAIDEIFSNIALYAYKEQQGDVKLECSVKDGVMKLTFIDSGPPFNPLDATEPDTTLSAQERKIGGLGIFLVRKTMDDMQYSYEDANILTITKKIS